MSGEDDPEMRARAREERAQIVEKYDRGREEGAVIDDWEDPRLEIYHSQDRYGFIHDERLPEYGRTERDLKIVEKEMSRVDKWLEMTQNPKKYFPHGARQRDTMVGRVWKGVPLRMRGELWKILLDVDTLKKQQPGVYNRMKLVARRHSPDIRQIDLDVNRTYRNHAMFRARYNTRQQDLFHVLAAYSMYNTEVGYCQGMSQIAALLLMYLISEEDAFWGLHKLMVGRNFKMHGLFIPHFPKLMRFQEHFDKILTKKLSRLQKHLVKNEVVSGIYTLKWFFQCFLDRLPFSLTQRVWDIYLLEGEVIMFAMAYTILKMHRQRLMKMGMDDLLEFLQKTLESNFGYEDDVVIEALRQNLLELRSSRLHSAGESPPNEEPINPFGMERLQTAEEELGYRLPFTTKEREFSLLTIQRENDTALKLSHINSQTSIDEGSFDHSLNDTVSVEPETEDHHSDLLEQDISMDIPDSPADRSESHTPSDRSQAPSENSRGRGPVLPPSPLPPSKEQDELDDTVLNMLKQIDFSSTTLDSTASAHHNPNLPTPANHHSTIPANHHAATPANHHNHSDRLHIKHNPPRPASADQHKFVNKDDRKRHSAHVPINSGHADAAFPHFVAVPGSRSPIPPSFGVPGSRSPINHSNKINNSERLSSQQQSSASKRHSSVQDDPRLNSSSGGDARDRMYSGDGRDRHLAGAARSNSRSHNNLSDYREKSRRDSEPRVRSGSRSSRTSHGSRASRKYYFGEEPAAAANGAPEDPGLNESFETATPHKGEVVRIRVSGDRDEGGGGIRREAKEISPRYNGHKVTIQVNRSSPDLSSPLPPPPAAFTSKQISSHQVTKKLVSSSVKKVVDSEEIHRSTHSMMLTQHSKNSQGESRVVRGFEETRTRDGQVTSHHSEHSQSIAPQMTPVYRESPPDPSNSREYKNSRSSRSSASDRSEQSFRKETFF